MFDKIFKKIRQNLLKLHITAEVLYAKNYNLPRICGNMRQCFPSFGFSTIIL